MSIQSLMDGMHTEQSWQVPEHAIHTHIRHGHTICNAQETYVNNLSAL